MTTSRPFATKRTTMTLLALALGGCGDLDEYDEPVETAQSDLLIHRESLWVRSPQALSVCWEGANTADPDENAGRALARAAVDLTWGDKTGMAFTGWGLCTGAATDIRLKPLDDRSMTGGPIGNALYNRHPSIQLNVTFKAWGDRCTCSAAGMAREEQLLVANPTWTRGGPEVRAQCRLEFSANACTMSTAMHEFGHALGFSHEQARVDTPASEPSKEARIPGDEIYWGNYDKDSIMNYNNPKYQNYGRLSTSDLAGARIAYGWGTDQPVGRPFTSVRGGNFRGANDWSARNLVIFRPTEGNFYTTLPNQPQGSYFTWGTRGDEPVIADFNGDSAWDMAVWRRSNANWYVRKGDGTVLLNGRSYGQIGDIPVVGDYDGDMAADLAVFRPKTGQWFAQKLNGTIIVNGTTWGAGTGADVPVPGDYDGDGKADLAVFRRLPSGGGQFFVRRGLVNTVLVNGLTFGEPGDIPVPGDYDGDRKSDLALYRPTTGQWFIVKATGQAISTFGLTWGEPGDIPVPGDFDNDNISDLTVYRPSSATWWTLRLSDFSAIQAPTTWGLPST